MLWTAGAAASAWGLASAVSSDMLSSLGVARGLALLAGAIAFVAVGELDHRRTVG